MTTHRVGITFTETMRGFWSMSATSDCETAAAAGRRDGTPFEFTLTVTIDDLTQMLADEEHRGRLSGSVTAPALEKEPLAVEDGVFRLFIRDSEHAATRNMVYEFKMTSQSGRCYFFHGFKVVRDTGPHVWRDTSTLFIDVYEGETPEGPLIGRGVLRILLGDFRRQLASMEVTGTRNPLERLQALADFNRFFLGVLVDIYGRVLAKPSVFNPTASPRERRQLRLPEAELHRLETGDGALLELTRYHAGSQGPVLLVPGLGVSAASFAIDTIDTNLVEFLCEHDYDVWLLDHRGSPKRGSPATQYTLDDIAAEDYPAAIEKIRSETGSPDVQVVAHCTGSLALLMALLRGLPGIRSAVLSQMGIHPSASVLQTVKSNGYLAEFLTAVGAKQLDTYYDSNSGWADRLYDTFLRFYPTRERCNSPVCRRILVTYGEVFKHEQLNESTHESIHELFGTTGFKVLEHLARIIRNGSVVTANGEDVYLPHAERLRLPLTLIHGADNRLLLPAGSERSFRWLCEKNGELSYRYCAIPGYGHLDCIIGRDAARDVFPLILQELQRIA